MIIATKKKKKETSKEEDKNNTWVKATEDTKKIKEVWSDGYDFGDVTKTILGVSKIAKDTTKDALVNIGKGFMSTVEGSVDSIRYGMSDVYRKLAEKNPDQTIMTGGIVLGKPQQISDKLKENAQYEVTKNLLGEENDIFKENWSAKVDEKSVLGNKSDSIFQGVGNVGAFVGMSQLTGGSNLSTFLNSFSSAYGNARTEAYKNGADDKTANRAGWVSGLAEGISEQFFSGIPGMKTAGWGDALNSRLSKAIQKYLGSTAGKMALTLFDGLGEGSEEIISNILNTLGTDVMHYIDKNYTYGMENMSGNVLKDTLDSAFSQDSLDSFVSAMLTSVLTGGGKATIQGIRTNQISNQVANQGNITKEQATNLLNQIAEKRANLELDEDANFKERTETIDNEKLKLAKEIKQATKSGQQVDLNELLNQTPSSRQEMQFTLDQDEVKNIKSDKQKVLANDMARLNNVKENHDLFKVVNAIQSANDTQQYHITTTEGLYEMGIVNKDENGNYTMPDGSPYVPRGLNYKNGEIYINADVGSQSGTQAVYHEMFEGFKKAAPEQYNEFKKLVTEIVGQEEINNEIAKYTEMYGENKDIEDEIINDKFGELAESQDFINKIADNRNVLEKFIDSIKNMIKYVKGTDEERQLMKLQKNLEKEFAKRYKETDFSQGEGDTAYSLVDKNGKILPRSKFQEMLKDIQNNRDEEFLNTFKDAINKKIPDFFNKNTSDMGIELTKEQQEYFKDSKIRGINDSLTTVYHTTTDKIGQFNEFNPTGTDYYRFGDQVVNFYTNSKEMSGSYAGQEYRMADTSKLNSVEEAKKWLKENTNHYDNFELKEEHDSFGQPIYIVYRNGKQALVFTHGEEELLKKLKGSLEDYVHAFKDIDKLETEDTRNKIQYEGYINITNPYVVDAEARNWNQVVTQSNDLIDNLDIKLSEETKNNLTRLYNESRNKSNEARDEYEKYEQLIREINDTNNKAINDETRKMNHLISRLGIDSVIKLSNNQSVGVSGWYTLADVLKQDDIIGETTSNYIINEFRIPSEVKEWIDRELYGEINYKGIKNLKELYDKKQEAYNEFDKYRMPNSYFIEKYIEDNSEYVDLEFEDLLEERAEMLGTDAALEEIAEAASVGFSKPEMIRLWGTSKSTNDIAKEVLASNADGKTNYDGIIIKNVIDYGGTARNVTPQDVYITFNSNQFKGVDNKTPTSDPDIRYSMTSNENIDSKEIAPVGSTVEETIAPIREDLSNITEQMNNLSNQIETLQNGLETQPSGYVETYNEQRNENIPTRQLTEEDANTLQDALMQDEGYLRSLDEQANLNTENTKLIDRLTNNVTERLDLEKGQKETLRNIVKESVENGYSADEISQALQKEFSEMSYEMTNQEAIDARKLIRDIPIKVSDAIKTDIADYGKWKSSNFGKINFSNSGSPVDSVYAELSNRMPYFFPSDISNPTDQLLKIAEVANMATKVTETIDVDPSEFDNIADYIKNTTLEDQYNAQMNSQYDLDKNIQFDMAEDIAPTTIRTQESIDDYIENRDIAPVREDMGTRRNNSPLRDRLETIRRRFGEMITNRNYIIDETAKATGNRQIKFAGDMLNSVSGEAQYNINNKQTDMNGNVIGKSVTEIFEPSKKAGLYEAFNDYLVQKSNIERHRVGKGSQVPEVVSQQLVKMYETENPQFKEWAKDVYKYFDNVLQEQVDAGLITQEQFNNYRGEEGIYRSYVPFYEGEIDTNRFFDNEGKVKPVSTLKRSTGNATDVNQLLAVEDSMAKQTYAYKRAIRQNELYKEIVNSLDKYSDAMDMDLRDNPTNLDDVLYTTPDGDKILSAYVDGEKMSAKISDELYNELSGDNEARIKQLEDDFSLITKPLQKVSNVRRNILTSWNPTFLARNAIKDIQDAVINSKHTGDMLKNYFGLRQGQKSAVFELREGKTKEAQQFLALYGADNLYGDYSNVGQKKGLINKFARANELIELAPRFAEFKASLQNGESVQEAIYNAREVTTNFGRGGYITKALNRNGFTFLNANVQGLNKLVRNLSGENGVKGVTSVVVKGAVFAVLPSILNELLYGAGDDKDEEYEALPDYIKDNYYLIKTEGNKFVRIPKGRINAAFGSLARRTVNAIEGDENAYEGALSNAWDQIGVGDLGGNNILAPMIQAFGSQNGEAWYGGDIVPTRLQNKPASEQTDAKIDAISNAIGELFGVSPYKVNYVLDQYTGGAGDILLPMITPETKSGAEKPHEYLLAPIKDAFVVNSTDDNKYAGEFYTAKDKAQIQSNSQYATDEDKLRYKYMSNISSQMSELYKERREVQADTTLGNKEKYAKVQAIQNEINNLAKEGLNNYDNFNNTENYSNIGDTEYYKNAEGEWTKVSDDEQEFTAGLNDAEKTAYYNVKNKINGITQDYTAKTKDLDKNDSKKAQYSAERKENITQTIVNSGLDNNTKAMIYSKYYSNKDTMNNVVNAGYNIDTYITALNDIEQIRNKYSQKNGYSTEERKQRTIAYINSLEMEIPQKAMMIRQYYTSFREYNNDIVNFVGNLNIPYEDKKAILEGTGMTVNGNNVSWK